MTPEDRHRLMDDALAFAAFHVTSKGILYHNPVDSLLSDMGIRVLKDEPA